MKLITTLTLALAADAVSAAALQARHYIFPGFTNTADWSSVRTTANHLTREPITDVTSPLLRCNELTPGTGAAATQDVPAGTTLSFRILPYLVHPGPLQFYLAKAPAGTPVASWDGAGTVWFKIYAEPVRIDSAGGLSWASLSKDTANVTIPAATPPGEYLLRIEHLALHNAAVENGAQFHVACAQIRIAGGGAGTPGPLVAFPGAYAAGEKGLRVYVFSSQKSYTPPGPAVWSG